MVYTYQQGVIVPFIQKFKMQLILAVAAIFMASMASMTLMASAAPIVDANGCSFINIGTTYTLQADCVSTQRIDIPAGATLDGDGHTISSSFSKTNNSNNASIGVLNSNVTIQDLVIDGTGGTGGDFGLHGINVFQSTGVVINNVTIVNMMRSGIVVNGSEVTVSNVTTSGNGWNGINVDRVNAMLNITGTMHQTDNAQIYVDNTTTGAVVKDVLSQYIVSQPITTPDRPFDKLYTLKVVIGSKDGCKEGGWATSNFPVFKNQGQCVASFTKNAHAN